MLRQLEFDIISAGKFLSVFVKIGPWALFGFVVPPLEKWIGTRIAAHRGEIYPKKRIAPKYLISYFINKAKQREDFNMKISKKQREKIDSYLIENIEWFKSSDQWRAMKYDIDNFGEGAVLRKSD